MLRILVVEDHALVRGAVADTLTRAGMLVTAQAGNAEGKCWTPFRETCQNVADAVKETPGINIKDLVDKIPFMSEALPDGQQVDASAWVRSLQPTASTLSLSTRMSPPSTLAGSWCSLSLP